MKRFYYLKKGKAEGPLTQDEIQEGIQIRQFGPFDLLYQEGDVKWKPLAEFDEFRSALAALDAKKVVDQWIVLLRKSKEEGRGFNQKGPYSTEEVRAMIQKGLVRYTDYVWKQGMKEWYKIANIDVFNRPQPKRVKFGQDVEVPPLPEVGGETVLADIATLERKKAEEEKESEPPSEAEGPDLVATKIFAKKEDPPPLTSPSVPVAQVIPGPATEFKDDTHPSETQIDVKEETKKLPLQPGQSPYRQERKKQSQAKSVVRKSSWVEEFTRTAIKKAEAEWDWRYFVHIIAVGGLVFIIAFIVLISTYRDQFRVDKSARKKSAAATTPAVAEKKASVEETSARTEKPTVPVEKPAEPPAAVVKAEPVKRAPTYLRITPRNLRADQPVVIFDSDASEHYLLKVKVKAEAGDVLQYQSFYREYSFRLGPSVKLDLKAEGYPAGQYSMEASVENIVRQKEFFVGREDGEFKTKLAKHRKSITYWHQAEKRDLYLLTKSLEAKIENLSAQAVEAKSAAARSRVYQNWRKAIGAIQHKNLERVSLRSASKFVYPFLWMELRDLKNQVDAEMRRFSSGASAELGSDWAKIRSQIGELKNKSLALTLF